VIAAGFDGQQVDGNDVVAVHGALAAALEQTRGGGGPHLVEALTYCLCDHTTADDASRYRDDTEVSRHWPEEPVLRLRQFLTELGQWTKADEERLLHEIAAEITAAANAYLA
jgi:2-oxoisovalerate dehydrogenase E1 component alpha subunit